MQKTNLKSAVEKLLKEYERKISSFSIKDFLKSDIDPFRFEFNASIWGLENAVKKEIEHKIEMSLEDLFGNFHEDYLGNATHEPSKTKWKNLPVGEIPGIDIANTKKRYFLQIKNKHNSMNSSSATRLAQQLEQVSKTKRGSTVGCGWVIAGSHRKCIGEGDIAAVGKVLKGRDLYTLVTGKRDEMDLVQAEFPVVLKKAVKGHNLNGLIDGAAKRVSNDLQRLAKAKGLTIDEYLYQEAVK